MRDFVNVYINGIHHKIEGGNAFLSLSDFLRLRLRLVGTKIVCSEGDCGSCSVLIGRSDGDRLHYRVIDSCIQFMYQLDNTHIVSIEGLRYDGKLNPVQQAMVDCHGSQCGFCTPGFIVALHGLFESDNGRRDEGLGEPEMRRALTGNLCRCTGYVQIYEAGESIDPRQVRSMKELYPEAEMLASFAEHCSKSVMIKSKEKSVQLPATLAEAIKFKSKNNDAKVVTGATDIGVQTNKGNIAPANILGLNNISGCDTVEIADGKLICGANATWTQIENKIKDVVPEFYKILQLFGSPQIRNAGVIGGNIINASPIADSLPFLFVTESKLELTGTNGSRTVGINDFYTGYKQFDLQPDELLTKIITPLPAPDEILKLYKVSRRRDLDISTFTGAILMKRNDDQIEWARIAYGGCGPVVYRLVKTEEFLAGKDFSEETMRKAGRLARTEISPISDVRGSADFRFQLAENIPLKLYFECLEELTFA